VRLLSLEYPSEDFTAFERQIGMHAKDEFAAGPRIR
jgi:hypothetical protein